MQLVSVTLSDSSTLLDVDWFPYETLLIVLTLYLISFVTKEVDLIILLLNILQAVGLVPALREDVKADLAPY